MMSFTAFSSEACIMHYCWATLLHDRKITCIHPMNWNKSYKYCKVTTFNYFITKEWMISGTVKCMCVLKQFDDDGYHSCLALIILPPPQNMLMYLLPQQIMNRTTWFKTSISLVEDLWSHEMFMRLHSMVHEDKKLQELMTKWENVNITLVTSLNQK